MSDKESLILKPEVNTIGNVEPARPKVGGQYLVQGVAWNFVGDWATQLFSWATFVFMVRMLTPDDYGLLAMAGSFGPLVAYFNGAGIPRAIVTLRNLTEDQLAQLNTVGLLLGFFSFGLAVVAGKYISIFYHNRRAGEVFVIGCIGLITTGAHAVSNGLLLKAMRFRLLFIFGLCASLVGYALTFLFLWLGWGYWGLVWAGLISGTVRIVLVMCTRRQTYALPRWSDVKKPVKFAMYIVFGLIANNFYQNLDNLTAGKFLGQTALGYYVMAWGLAYVPLDKVTSMVTGVLPTYAAAIQHDLSLVRSHLVKITEGVSTLMFPACVGFGLVAHELIPLVMGAKWKPAVPPLEILSVYATVRSITALVPPVLIALGNPQFVLWNDVAATFILGISFFVGSHWGINGIAWGWVVGYPFVAAPLYWKTFTTIKMKPWDYFRRLYAPLEATLIMAAVIWLMKRAIAGNPHVLVRLISEVVVGVIVYTGILWIRDRERITFIIQLAKKFNPLGELGQSAKTNA